MEKKEKSDSNILLNVDNELKESVVAFLNQNKKMGERGQHGP